MAIALATVGLAFGVAAAGLVAARPLAVLTLTVADRDNRAWYRVWAPGAARPTGRRIAIVAGVCVVFAELAARAAGWSPTLPAWLVLALILAPLAVVDFERHRLPNRLVLPGYVAGAGLFGVASMFGPGWTGLGRAALAAAAAFGVFAVAAAGGGIGFGDTKLIGLLAAYLGWLGWVEILAGLFAGFALGALQALVLLASRRGGLRSAIAFGPALMLGALLVAALR